MSKNRAGQPWTLFRASTETRRAPAGRPATALKTGTLALFIAGDCVAATDDVRCVACALQVAVDHIVRDGHIAGSGIAVDLRIAHDRIARDDGTRVGAAPVIAADLQIAVDHSALDEGWPGIVVDLHIVQNRAALCEARGSIVLALEIAIDLDGKTENRVAVIPRPRTVLNLEITADGNRAQQRGQEHRIALMGLNVAVDRLHPNRHAARRHQHCKFRVRIAHLKTRLPAQSRRGLLLKGRALRAASHPRRVQTGTQGSYLARNRRRQPRSCRLHLDPQTQSGGVIRVDPRKRCTKASAIGESCWLGGRKARP